MLAWNTAVAINTAASFEAFLASYANSDLAATARKMQERVLNRSLGANAALMPPPTNVAAMKAALDTPVVQVRYGRWHGGWGYRGWGGYGGWGHRGWGYRGLGAVGGGAIASSAYYGTYPYYGGGYAYSGGYADDYCPPYGYAGGYPGYRAGYYYGDGDFRPPCPVT